MNFANSKKQGDFGLGCAIAFFTKLGYTVSIPLTDSQDYDLIVDHENQLYRVQVKTCSVVRNQNYQVDLRVKGGNRSGTGKVKHFDNTKVDYLFVVSADEKIWCIPTSEINQKSIVSLNESYLKYMGC